MALILRHLLPGHVMDKVQFLTCIRKGSIRKAESWGKYWTYFRIRPYGILGVGEAVHGRMMCLHQVLGLRSAGPVLELCAKWERPVASWSLQGWASCSHGCVTASKTPVFMQTCRRLEHFSLHGAAYKLNPSVREAEGDLEGVQGAWAGIFLYKMSQQVHSSDLPLS